MWAIEREDLGSMKSLVAHGASLTLENEDGNDALLLAVLALDTDSVRYMIQNGVSARHVNKKGFTALWKAVEYEDLEIVKMLIDAGSDLACKAND